MKGMHIEVNGIVQGVGFRPFIHKLVKNYGIKGWVKNTSNGVIMEVEGDTDSLLNFYNDIKTKSPKLSDIEKISFEFYEDLSNYDSFTIVKSTEEKEQFTLVSPDVCICDDCIDELFNPDNRRYRFPFINCTNCGPRFTIIKDIPYDRDMTTMDIFPMCDDCKREYKDIEDRRYHAQPDCCYKCGPRLFFMDTKGEIKGDPIELAKSYLKSGKIIAIKGLGGIHLACDARNTNLISELRKRKQRDEKPFAIMCRDIETVKKICYLSNEEKDILTSHKRPIVLLKRKNEDFKYISLDNDYIGVMLPYTPVHYLLMEKEIDVLIMTSANISDTPIIYKNEDALDKLKGVCDAFLLNNRDIHTRCDDSLMMVFEGNEYPIRRSRGYAPFPIKVYEDVGQILACGAEQKASFAISKENYVFLSQHIGDLKNMETLEHYESQIEYFKKLFRIDPKMIVCDLHPEYMSTDYAENISKEKRVPLTYVQHHHAHLASCMTDNNLVNDVIGIIWDGTGYGLDGITWGGEFLVGNYSYFKRPASIRPIRLPGGDRATKEIYKIGYSLIKDSIGYIPDRFNFTKDCEEINKMLDVGFNCPSASSIGRLFDGVASILGIKSKASYEGQGAIKLESAALETKDSYSLKLNYKAEMLEFDWRKTIAELLDDVNNGVLTGICASKFMNTLVNMAVEVVKRISSEYGIKDVVMSGGVFQNLYILSRLKKRLVEDGFNVYSHKRVSTNDEGISLGQIMIAFNGGGVDVSCNTFNGI